MRPLVYRHGATATTETQVDGQHGGQTGERVYALLLATGRRDKSCTGGDTRYTRLRECPCRCSKHPRRQARRTAPAGASSCCSPTCLLVATLLGALGLAGFSLVVAAAAQRWDVVVLLLCIVVFPVALVGHRRRDSTQGRAAVIAYAAMVWSLPFLLGFGVIAFVGTQGNSPSRAVTGFVAVSIVVSGTMLVDRLAVVPAPGQA